MKHSAFFALPLVLILGISCKGLLSDEPDDQPPVVRVIRPLDGVTIFADSIVVGLHIVDESPICQISYFIDGKKRVKIFLGVAGPDRPTDRTFEMSFKDTAGEHFVHGEVEDCHGNVGSSPPVIVTLIY